MQEPIKKDIAEIDDMLCQEQIDAIHSELLSCPFCGSPASLTKNKTLTFVKLYRIFCSYELCIARSLTGNFENIDSAKKAWNTRVNL